MPKKYEPSPSELSSIQYQISDLLKDYPKTELTDMLERVYFERISTPYLDVDESESEEEEEQLYTESSSDDESDED
jgi:glutaredoxin